MKTLLKDRVVTLKEEMTEIDYEIKLLQEKNTVTTSCSLIDLYPNFTYRFRIQILFSFAKKVHFVPRFYLLYYNSYHSFMSTSMKF